MSIPGTYSTDYTLRAEPIKANNTPSGNPRWIFPTSHSSVVTPPNANWVHGLSPTWWKAGDKIRVDYVDHRPMNIVRL